MSWQAYFTNYLWTQLELEVDLNQNVYIKRRYNNVPHQIREETIKNVKEEVSGLVSDAKRSVGKIDEAVSNCDAFQLSFLIGDADDARGAAGVLVKLVDDAETRKMWKEAADAHILAYKCRDRFITECYCQKKYS